VHIELRGSMGQPGLEFRPEGQADGAVRDGRDDAPMDDPLGVEVMSLETHVDLGLAVSHRSKLQPDPLVERRASDPVREFHQLPLIEP
jgi:hypothetical protein